MDSDKENEGSQDLSFDLDSPTPGTSKQSQNPTPSGDEKRQKTSGFLDEQGL